MFPVIRMFLKKFKMAAQWIWKWHMNEHFFMSEQSIGPPLLTIPKIQNPEGVPSLGNSSLGKESCYVVTRCAVKKSNVSTATFEVYLIIRNIRILVMLLQRIQCFSLPFPSTPHHRATTTSSATPTARFSKWTCSVFLLYITCLPDSPQAFLRLV